MSGNLPPAVFSATLTLDDPWLRLGPPGDGTGTGVAVLAARLSLAAFEKSALGSIGEGTDSAACGVKIGVIAGGGQFDFDIKKVPV